MYDLIIIGGGASGMAAAITAGERGKNVLLLEKEDKLGKKILASGNGKCNLSATDVAPEKYNAPDFVQSVIRTDVEGFFHRLGLATKRVGERIYPYSESALSVVNVLRKNLKCDIKTCFEVTQIEKGETYFTVNGIETRNVLLASGSRASFGTDACDLYACLGIGEVARRPSVVPLVTDDTYVKGAANLRAKGRVTLLSGGKPCAS